MYGAYLNALGIFVGALFGLAMVAPVSARLQQFFKSVLGLFTALYGLRLLYENVHGSFMDCLKQLLLAMVAVVLGNWLGRLLRLQKLSNRIGRYAAGFLNAAVFSPDGRFILGGEGWPSFSARLWDARTGAELRVFAEHAGEVDSVAFDTTGTAILTGAEIVRLWSMADIAARLESERRPNGLELRWKVGALQQSANPNGPWVDITNAVSPWLAPINQASAFFRTRAQLE